jgi:hypothetical protein
MRVQSNVDSIGACGCGRAPQGKCNGWHGLSEEAYLMELELWNQTNDNLSSLQQTKEHQLKNE